MTWSHNTKRLQNFAIIICSTGQVRFVKLLLESTTSMSTLCPTLRLDTMPLPVVCVFQANTIKCVCSMRYGITAAKHSRFMVTRSETHNIPEVTSCLILKLDKVYVCPGMGLILSFLTMHYLWLEIYDTGCTNLISTNTVNYMIRNARM